MWLWRGVTRCGNSSHLKIETKITQRLSLQLYNNKKKKNRAIVSALISFPATFPFYLAHTTYIYFEAHVCVNLFS